MTIYVFALNGVFDTGLATVLDVFGTANELAAMSGLSVSRFEITIVSISENVKTSKGLTVPVSLLPLKRKPDCVIVPAIGYKMPDELVSALHRPDLKMAYENLRMWAAQGVTIASACIGTFILAESGMLNGHQATTTWWLAPLFRKRYPNIFLDETRMLVKSEQFITGGAALSHIDMAISIIKQMSPKLATMTAKFLAVDTRPLQSGYILSDHLNHSDPLVEKFERWARSKINQSFSLDDAAEAVGSSKRTLARRMQAVLGCSPLSYVQDLRVEKAVHLLKTTHDSVEDVAAKVGYADGVTLRSLLRRRLGHGVKELRKSR
jgi:transcriptional regulator GlxA family with amidase domain